MSEDLIKKDWRKFRIMHTVDFVTFRPKVPTFLNVTTHWKIVFFQIWKRNRIEAVNPPTFDKTEFLFHVSLVYNLNFHEVMIVMNTEYIVDCSEFNTGFDVFRSSKIYSAIFRI